MYVCMCLCRPTDRNRGGRASHAIGAPVKGQEWIVFARGICETEGEHGDSLVSVWPRARREQRLSE